jgi:formylglycine-generating enzyme
MKASTYQLSALVFLFLTIYGCKRSSTKIDGMVRIQGEADLPSYWIDLSPVSVAQFDTFVQQQAYQTQAEKFGDGGVFDFKTGTWSLVKGATWQFPFGPEAGPAAKDHPVTQVSWNDAVAYCAWAKKRLPTSDEFILAEKNGKPGFKAVYTWGSESQVNKKFKTNYWQGSFPYYNSGEDGFLTTSPIGYFGANDLGLTDIEGNVWQWCSDESVDRPGEMNQRGGSFLCDPAVCHGFKIGGSASSTAETSLCHVGFRCACDD